MTIAKKILAWLWSFVKIFGTIVFVIITGKFLWDLIGASGQIGVKIRELRTGKWKRDPKDGAKKTAPSDKFTEEDFDAEIDKLQNP